MTASSGEVEASYYQSIEEFFVSRRGDPLFLSNKDWLLVRSWRKQGIPLRIVLRGIADALDSHAHSWGRRQKVASLGYCGAEVEVAFERWRRALALGGETGLDLPGILEGLARALFGATGLGAAGAREARRLGDELQRRANDPGSGAGLDAWLSGAEARLLDAVAADLGPDGCAQVEAAVDADLSPYAGRLPAEVLKQVREDALKRRLLEAHGIPRLSLFHVA